MPRASAAGVPVLDQDLGGGLVGAALTDELDRMVQVCVASRQTLREGERVARLDQHVQPPALDFRALAAVRLKGLGRLSHDQPGSPSHRRTLPLFVCREAARKEQRSGTCERLVDPPRELLEPSLEDGPLGLGVGDEPVDAAAKLVLRLPESPIEL
jgi:hypothetical protein